MSSKIFKAISFLFIIIELFSIKLNAQQKAFTPEMEKNIDKFFENWQDPNKPGVAAGIVYQGKIAYLKGFGGANLENKKPISQNTSFNIGDLSKQFTAFAVLLLEEQGKLSLSDDVRKYIPQLPAFNKTITIKDLLGQSSGLHEFWALEELAGWGSENICTQQDLLNFLKNQTQLDYDPGTHFSLTSTGILLLPEIVAKASGQSFINFTREQIFDPLNMTNTQFAEDAHTIIPNAAISYQATENGFKSNPLHHSFMATNLYTSVADLCQWYLNFENPKVGSQALINKLDKAIALKNGKTFSSTSGTLTYGQQFDHYERGLRSLWTYGFAGGYASNIFRFPEQELTVFVIGNNNQYNGAPAMRSAYEILGDQFPEPPSIEFSKMKTKKLNTAQLTKHEGYYFNKNSGLARRIYSKNDTLRYARIGTNRENLLVPLTDKKFQMVIGSDDKIYVWFDELNGKKRMLFKGGVSNEYIHESYSPVTYNARELSSFTGTYYSPELSSIYTFQIKDNQLTASHLRKQDIVFTPVFKDLFTGSEWYFGSIKFERNKQEEITGFSVNFDGVKNLLFKKTM